MDLEVTQVLRRLARQEVITENRADGALHDLLDLPHSTVPSRGSAARIWQLRHNLSAYDAAYIALAEQLAAPLVTRESRLASTSGHAARIELF